MRLVSLTAFRQPSGTCKVCVIRARSSRPRLLGCIDSRDAAPLGSRRANAFFLPRFSGQCSTAKRWNRNGARKQGLEVPSRAACTRLADDRPPRVGDPPLLRPSPAFKSLEYRIFSSLYGANCRAHELPKCCTPVAPRASALGMSARMPHPFAQVSSFLTEGRNRRAILHSQPAKVVSAKEKRHAGCDSFAAAFGALTKLPLVALGLGKPGRQLRRRVGAPLSVSYRSFLVWNPNSTCYKF